MKKILSLLLISCAVSTGLFAADDRVKSEEVVESVIGSMTTKQKAIAESSLEEGAVSLAENTVGATSDAVGAERIVSQSTDDLKDKIVLYEAPQGVMIRVPKNNDLTKVIEAEDCIYITVKNPKAPSACEGENCKQACMDGNCEDASCEAEACCVGEDCAGCEGDDCPAQCEGEDCE